MTPETKAKCIEAIMRAMCYGNLLKVCYCEDTCKTSNRFMLEHKYRRGATAAIDAIMPIIEPPGTVRVPVEPTAAMRHRGGNEFAMTAQRPQHTADDCARDIYRAMIAAAQESADG